MLKQLTISLYIVWLLYNKVLKPCQLSPAKRNICGSVFASDLISSASKRYHAMQYDFKQTLLASIGSPDFNSQYFLLVFLFSKRG